MNCYPLSNLSVGDFGYIKEIKTQIDMKRRLYDLGLIPGTRVTCLQKSIFGDPVAFLIRGAVIALRGVDSKRIYIDK